MPKGGEPRISKIDAEAIRCTEQLVEAMQNLRRILETREGTLRESLHAREPASDVPASDVPASDVPASEFTLALKEAKITEHRDELNEALFALEQARRNSRIASFRSALDHGVSINELSRIWGFSRQMASRYAKEAREGT